MKEYEAAFQNQPVDVSEEFAKQQNHYFVGSVAREFDPDTATAPRPPNRGSTVKGSPRPSGAS